MSKRGPNPLRAMFELVVAGKNLAMEAYNYGTDAGKEAIRKKLASKKLPDQIDCLLESFSEDTDANAHQADPQARQAYASQEQDSERPAQSPPDNGRTRQTPPDPNPPNPMR